MPRHAKYVPHGVIPAVLLPFDAELAIDEASFRKHLRDVAATEGLSAITINAHSTEVGSCTFEEQRRVLDIAQDEIGDRLPLVVLTLHRLGLSSTADNNANLIAEAAMALSVRSVNTLRTSGKDRAILECLAP